MNPTNRHTATPPAGDDLSPTCLGILTARPEAYGDLVARPHAATHAETLLGGVTPAQLLAVPVRDREAADAMLAGLWLWHDALDRSHAISQAIASETGSFWHAIMHRREGDFSNAKYWYARCRRHPVLARIPDLGAAEPQFEPDLLAMDRVVRNGWDGAAFVDLVEDVYEDPAAPRHAAVVRLQRLEWRALFDHCARLAAGRPG